MGRQAGSAVTSAGCGVHERASLRSGGPSLSSLRSWASCSAMRSGWAHRSSASDQLGSVRTLRRISGFASPVFVVPWRRYWACRMKSSCSRCWCPSSLSCTNSPPRALCADPTVRRTASTPNDTDASTAEVLGKRARSEDSFEVAHSLMGAFFESRPFVAQLPTPQFSSSHSLITRR